MLSRVAENLYWISRYVERAENVARLLDVGFHLELDASGLTRQPGDLGPIESVLTILACRDGFEHAIMVRRIGPSVEAGSVGGTRPREAVLVPPVLLTFDAVLRNSRSIIAPCSGPKMIWQARERPRQPGNAQRRGLEPGEQALSLSCQPQGRKHGNAFGPVRRVSSMVSSGRACSSMGSWMAHCLATRFTTSSSLAAIWNEPTR